jgi:lysophospholipase L1-like esterase
MRSFNIRTVLFVIAAIVLSVGALVAVSRDSTTTPANAEHAGDEVTHLPPPEYVALGDSVAVGEGASDPEATGYVPLLGRHLAETFTPGQAASAPGAQTTGSYFHVTNFAVGGETSETLISGGQLQAALELIESRNSNGSPADDVKVITLSVGGNDLTPLFDYCPSVGPLECQIRAGEVLDSYGQHLFVILGQLRTAAGPESRIVVMTYYNPLVNPACPLAGYVDVAELIRAGLNTAITSVAATVPGVEIADVGNVVFDANDVRPDCLHPTDAGHAKIADTFVDLF